MDKRITSVMAVLLILGTVTLSGCLDSGGDESDWTSYPYVIPNTDMRFPDEEGMHHEKDTWISIGFKLDFPDEDVESMYLILLYLPNFKDVFISVPDFTASARMYGSQTLPEGKLNMNFENQYMEDMPMDVLKVREGEAFHYDLISYIELDGGDIILDVELESEKPPATMFDGQVDIGREYYRFHAFTNCTVRGTMEMDGEVYEVRGQAWLENLRGWLNEMKWDWFAFWDDQGNEVKIVDLYGSLGGNVRYAMYVRADGKVVTVDDIVITPTSFKDRFAFSWEITSEEYDIDLNITSIENRMSYTGFAFGIGHVSGTLMGVEIDDLTYIELTKKHS